MTRTVDDLAQRSFFADDLCFGRQHLRAVVVVLQLRQNLAAVNDIAFFDFYGFDLAAQFGAEFDVFRERLDLARTCNQQRSLLFRRSRCRIIRGLRTRSDQLDGNSQRHNSSDAYDNDFLIHDSLQLLRR